MKMAFASACALGMMATSLLGDEIARVFRPPSPLTSAETLVRMKYGRQLLKSPGPNRILLTQELRLTGTVEVLNRFLADATRLPAPPVVYLTGPEGPRGAVPLTASAAKAGVDYDWCVQIVPGSTTITIPLGGRIAFSQLHVPAELQVEASRGAPHAAKDFADLHNAGLHHADAE